MRRMDALHGGAHLTATMSLLSLIAPCVLSMCTAATDAPPPGTISVTQWVQSELVRHGVTPQPIAGATGDAGADEVDAEAGPSPVIPEAEDEEATMPKDASRSQRSRFGRLRGRGHYLVLVPSVRVEASFGVEFGVSGRYAYRPKNRALNMVLLSLQSRLSTKMVQEHELALRVRDVLGNGELFLLDARFLNDPRFTYAGLANGTRLSNEALEDDRAVAEVENVEVVAIFLFNLCVYIRRDF